VFVVAGAPLVECRSPTQLRVSLATDFGCAGFDSVAVAAGGTAPSASRARSADSRACNDGQLGSIVIVPSGAKDDAIALEVSSPAGCATTAGSSCIVARRRLRYLPHTPLQIPVVLHAGCRGVACPVDQTCIVDGRCVDAELKTCTNTAGCDEAALGGADAGSVGPSISYGDIRDPSFWATFDLGSAAAGVRFEGALFDGRYVYLVPHDTFTGPSGVVARYDSHAPFAQSDSWTVFDAGAVNARGFAGGAFDGRYVYFAPRDGIGLAGRVARYDTQASFGAAASWTTFDLTTVSARAQVCEGAAFDGRYVYFAPIDGTAVRYDTQAPFDASTSWAAFDLSTVGSGGAYAGATFDGRYVYLVPGGLDGPLNGTIVRFDAQAPFDATASWSTFDATTLSASATGFQGAAFDGRYLYLVPLVAGVTYGPGGLAVRYDIRAPFGADTSWTLFDTTGVAAGAKGFAGPAYDGRYVYFVPFSNEAAGSPFHYDGLVTRVDTLAPFAAASSWATFDVGAVNPGAGGFTGAAFDGRYVYFAPSASTNVVARFDARTPPAMPPGFAGSFL
jgi:hypothetical protein